jgi:periplasmic protein CpxP/Spy
MLKSIKFGAPIVAVLVFFGLSLVTRAQDTSAQQSSAQAESQNGMHQGQHASRLEWMSKELNLTDDQKAKLKPILADEGKQMQSVKEDTTLSQDQKRDKMKEIRQKTDSQVNDILTPDQQKKYADLKAEQQQKMRQQKQEESKPQPQP